MYDFSQIYAFLNVRFLPKGTAIQERKKGNQTLAISDNMGLEIDVYVCTRTSPEMNYTWMFCMVRELCSDRQSLGPGAEQQ